MKIILKRSSVQNTKPTVDELELGELAINTFDGKIYTKTYDNVQENIVEVGSGLQSINEGNGFGWRLRGENPDNHEPVGENSIDLTINNDPNVPSGAPASNSIAIMQGAVAAGNYSMAVGFGSVVNADGAIALGEYTAANEPNSIVVGSYNLGLGGTAFEVGIGNSADFKNGLEVYKDGVVSAPELDVDTIENSTERVLTTREYIDKLELDMGSF